MWRSCTSTAIVAVFVCWLIPSKAFTRSVPPSSMGQRRRKLPAVHVRTPAQRCSFDLVGSSTLERATSSRLAASETGTGMADTEEYGTRRDPEYYERSKRWIVIVDDEEPIRTAVGQFLYDRGYRVTACADADTALRVSTTTRLDGAGSNGAALAGGGDATAAGAFDVPDAIVSDIRMPGRDGLEFLGIIRSDPRLVGVPVVLLTAKGMTQDRIAGYRAGADAYLPKPFNPEELLSILDNLIERHETLNGADVEVDDLKKDMDEIKHLILEKGGAGVGNGWVKATNVFLTPDERTVLEFLSKGLTNREIAEGMNLSRRRVEQHLTSMFRKTDVSNRTELVRWAISTGIVDV